MTKQKGRNFSVLDLRMKDEEFIFYVERNSEKKWVTREYVVNNHPLDLIKFYEKHANFIPSQTYILTSKIESKK